jgi:hypothetical protein
MIQATVEHATLQGSKLLPAPKPALGLQRGNVPDGCENTSSLRNEAGCKMPHSVKAFFKKTARNRLPIDELQKVTPVTDEFQQKR